MGITAFSKDLERNGMSQRGWDSVSSILPRISAAVQQREQPLHSNIDLSTSENWLMRTEWIELCKRAVTGQLMHEHLSYPAGLSGHPDLILALSKMLNKNFQPKVPVESSHIIAAPGAAGCIDALLYNICNAGDGVLLPGPYWSGFDLSIPIRSGVQPVVVELPELKSNFSDDLIRYLESAFLKASIPIKALILSNPHNPLGVCYSPELLESCIKFCAVHKIHFISDEIYALTAFKTPDTKNLLNFTSALSINTQKAGFDPSRVHVIWSTSKDLGQSGLRVGCIITQFNRELATTLALWTYPQVSQLTSVCVSYILESKEFPGLMNENSKRLSQAYGKLVSLFIECGIPYVPCNAGLYVFARLAPHAQIWDDEAEIATAMQAVGVILAQGKSYHVPESAKGWFRISFAIEPAKLDTAISRMRSVLRGRRSPEIYIRDPNT